MTTKVITNKPHIQTKSKVHEISARGNGVFDVVSGTSGEPYIVVIQRDGKSASCNCPWGSYRGWFNINSGCSHAVSAFRQILANQDRALSVWTNEEDASRQHRSSIDIGDGVILTHRKN